MFVLNPNLVKISWAQKNPFTYLWFLVQKTSIANAGSIKKSNISLGLINDNFIHEKKFRLTVWWQFENIVSRMSYLNEPLDSGFKIDTLAKNTNHRFQELGILHSNQTSKWSEKL